MRILVLKRLYNVSDEQIDGKRLLVSMSYERFFGLANATNAPDRTMFSAFENRIGEGAAKAVFDGVLAQLLKEGFIVEGLIIDATLVPMPTQHNRWGER